MAWNPESPYNTLPELPPRSEIESRAVLKAVISAREVLGRLDASARSLPDPSILINAIPLLEAQASSEIENIVTTTDELFSASSAVAGESTPATREALRYRSALHAGFLELADRPLTARTTTTICSILKGHDVAVRTGPVYITDAISGQRAYTPPDNRLDLERLLDNWTLFINEQGDLDPLVTMAVAHYQFEAIHPFTDGNGRTGRIVNVLMLCAAGLLHLPVVYPSRTIIETKSEYYRLLRAVTAEGAWEEWVLYLLNAVEQTAGQTLTTIHAIKAALFDYKHRIRDGYKFYSQDLINNLFKHPYTKIDFIMTDLEVSRLTATKYLDELDQIGIVQKMKLGRDNYYINTDLYNILSNVNQIKHV